MRYIASWKWYQRGTLVKHNFDFGVFVIIDVDLEEEVLTVREVGIGYMPYPEIEYYIVECQPLGISYWSYLNGLFNE